MSRESGERFARDLVAAEERLRAAGLGGRGAFVALVRGLARRLELPESLWPEGPDAPESARLDQIQLTPDLDLFGLAYERFFSDLFKGERGQYFTPQPLVELMADLAGVGPKDRVLDPTCGSGGFLLAALERGADIDGIEIDPELVALARLNLALRGANPRAIRRGDLFRESGDPEWSVILANPPFSVPVRDAAALADSEIAAGRKRVSSDVLFLESAWRRLAPQGRLCTVLPGSMLVNESLAPIRAWLDERFVRRAVISLPEGVFRPFGGTAARACVVLLQRRPAQVRDQLVVRIRCPGYDTTRKVYRRQEPDELAALRLHLRGEPFDGARRVPPTGPWAPGDHLQRTGIREGVPTVALGELMAICRDTLDPSATPDAAFTEVDLGDLDKSTGEVARARQRRGSDFVEGQSKVRFSPGQLLFGRMRPYLNNVGIASHPEPGLDGPMVGSTEWVPLDAPRDRGFALLALRSIFVREQLRTTGGQTRPRARIRELPAVQVPDPGAALRQRLARKVEEVHAERLALRHRLTRLEALFEAFGRGEIDAAELDRALDQ